LPVPRISLSSLHKFSPVCSCCARCIHVGMKTPGFR
jgi:hypothetical protein